MPEIQNLEQIRSFNASRKAAECRAGGDGDALSGYGGLVINSGLMGTLAFSLEKNRRDKQHGKVAHALAFHFNDRRIVALADGNRPLGDKLLEALQRADSFTLRRATDEALAFLSHLKRAVKSLPENDRNQQTQADD